MKLEIIFLGAPASGKGTQTKLLSKEMNLPHVDTGSMLRAEIEKGSKEGKIAQERMDKGNLVPTEIVSTIIKNRLKEQDCTKGFILDGYPRSIEQAEALELIFSEINSDPQTKIIVINLDVDQNILVERIINRRLCTQCGKIFNIKFCPSKSCSKCAECDGDLVQRQDDTEQVAAQRIKTYNEQTQPLIEFYSSRKVLVNVDGNKSVEEIFDNINTLIKKELSAGKL